MAIKIDYPITVETLKNGKEYLGKVLSGQDVHNIPITVQGDDLGRRLVVSFTQNGIPLELSGCSAQVKCSFNDSLIALNSCEVEDNTVIVVLTSTMLAQAGLHDVQVTLYDESGAIVSSEIFKIDVKKSIPTGEVEETSDFSALQDLTAQIKSVTVSDEELKNARGTFSDLGKRITAAEKSTVNAMRFLNAENCVRRSVGFTADDLGTDRFYKSGLTLSAEDGCTVAEGVAGKAGSVYALFDKEIQLTKNGSRQVLAVMRIKAVGTALKVFPICGRYQGYYNYFCDNNIIASNITEYIGNNSSCQTIPDGEWVTVWALLGGTGKSFKLGGDMTAFNGLGVYIPAPTDGSAPKLMIQSISAYLSDSEERGMLEQLKESIASDSNRLTTAEEKLREQAASIDGLTAEASEATRTLESLQSTVNEKADTLTEVTSRVENIEQNLSYYATEINDNEKSLSILQGTVNSTCDKLTEAETDITNIREQLTTVRDNIEALTNTDGDFSKRISDLERITENAVREISEIKSNIGLDDDVLGLQVDFEKKKFTRLAGASGLTPGKDFDRFEMFGGRKRCNVLDDGTITAYFGDENYAEDGSNGQVMVYQPAFYYKVVPVAYEKNKASGTGYHLRKVNYYISARAHNGFKLHPAFFDSNGNEVDYILYSAYEGCLYSNHHYVNDNAETSAELDLTTDLICSLAGRKPISGLYKPMTRANLEALCKNHGTGWHLETIKSLAANQLLMIVEYATMNLQGAIGQGVVSIPDNDSCNCASLTGSTSALGNATGEAAETVNEINGTKTTYTTSGKTAVSYRGIENPWGNMWRFVNGINVYGDGTMAGGQAYICDDLSFAEGNADNYKKSGFTLPPSSGFISAMGYSGDDYDWLMSASEIGGTSALPVGDYIWVAGNLNGYRACRFGGNWRNSANAGPFCCYYNVSIDYHSREYGGRLLYIPTGRA